jgi:hypothetical protein
MDSFAGESKEKQTEINTLQDLLSRYKDSNKDLQLRCDELEYKLNSLKNAER